MHHSDPIAHAQHDPDLIAGHAAGDLTDTDHSAADALLQSCATCADLRRDLLVIASATKALPPISAPRDFRLSAEQAARLRRGGLVRTLLRPFAATRSSVRPMAMAFTSLGLAGLLVANILPGLFTGGAFLALPGPQSGPGAAVATAGTGDTGAQPPAAEQPKATGGVVEVRGAGQPSQPADMTNEYSSGQSSSPPRDVAGAPGQPSDGAEAQRLNAVRQRAIFESDPISVVSLALLVVGLALFGLRFAARRVR